MEKLLKRKVNYPMSMELNPTQAEINRYLEKLDNVAREFEARWGIDRLPKLVDGELAGKWDRQIGKLNEAITSSDLKSMKGLVDGTIRAWSVLEEAALKGGHKPNPDDVWDFKHPDSGRHYRIFKTNADAYCKAEDGVVNYSLEEVARLLEKNQLVNVVKEQFPGSVVEDVKPEDWVEDRIPW